MRDVTIGIDASTPHCAVGGFDGSSEYSVTAVSPAGSPGEASRNLLGQVGEVIRGLERGMSDIGRVVVGVGPGSFTGVRTGIATAYGLARGLGAELTGVSSLGALLSGVAEGPLVAVVDARRGEVYVSATRTHRFDQEERVIKRETLLSDLASQSGATVIGDAAIGLRGELEQLGCIVPPDGDPVHCIDGAALARLVQAQGGLRLQVEPVYLRPPDAVARFA